MVIIGAPHTTNWDFILFLGALHYLKIHANYIAKHTLFRWPFNYFFNALGGIPVDRSKPGGIINQVAEAFYAADAMVLVVAPEGTRSAAPRWKSGFLRIRRGRRSSNRSRRCRLSAKTGPRSVRRFNIAATLSDSMDQAREFFRRQGRFESGPTGPDRRTRRAAKEVMTFQPAV